MGHHYINISNISSVAENISSDLHIMGGSSSKPIANFVENEEKVTKLSSDHCTITSDFQWKIESFGDFARAKRCENGNVVSPSFEIVHENLKAPLYFKLQISFPYADTMYVCIINDNDVDVKVNGVFYITNKQGRSVPIDKISTSYESDFCEYFGKYPDMNIDNIRNGVHTKILAGKNGPAKHVWWRDIRKKMERF